MPLDSAVVQKYINLLWSNKNRDTPLTIWGFLENLKIVLCLKEMPLLKHQFSLVILFLLFTNTEGSEHSKHFRVYHLIYVGGASLTGEEAWYVWKWG